MKLRILFLFVIFLSFSIVQINGHGQDVKWKGVIEEEDGIKVIKNPNEPLYGEIEFELEEDLSIGNEEDENYLFYGIMDIQVDIDGNIYALDAGNHRLQVFDKNGNYLCTIGKKGQGPGEFNRPSYMRLDDDTGNIFVTDRSRTVKIFDKEGQYIDKDIRVDGMLNDFYLDSDRCIWGKFVKPEIFIKKLTPAGDIEKTIAELPLNISRINVTPSKVGYTAKTTSFYFNHGYEYDLFISKIDNHTFIYGNSRVYELLVVDETGNILFVVRKDETPREITKDEKERIKNKIQGDLAKRGYFEPDLSIEFPEHEPYFYSIMTDDKGRIYVRRSPISRKPGINHKYDVYSKDGLYLYKALLNCYPYVIKNGYLYTLEMEDYEVIKRYKIKNWEQIKK